jgi:hypothetical protein
MELIQITTEMLKLYKLMSQDIETIQRLASLKAEAERDYKKNLRMEILKLRADSVPATLIPDLAKGECADLLFKHIEAESNFTATREVIGIRQTQASLLQSIKKSHEVL